MMFYHIQGIGGWSGVPGLKECRATHPFLEEVHLWGTCCVPARSRRWG